MFQKAKSIWKKYGYEICIILSIILILILALFRLGEKGTWSNKYFLDYKTRSSRKPPHESKGEIECRRVLEELFNRPFPKTRPNFLRNPVTSNNIESNNLEIDCYNDELKLGVEYNGIQHYKYIPYFHKTKDSFHNQKYRDYVKNDICQKNGITLIEVPYTVKIPEIKSFILNKLNYNKWTQKMR